jgi:hypothetical protein
VVAQQVERVLKVSRVGTGDFDPPAIGGMDEGK